jgi:hypothetical protein
MKDFAGIIFALLLDFRWWIAAVLIIATFFGLCPLARAEEHDTDIIATWFAHDDSWTIFIQRGANGCEKGSHYAFAIDNGEFNHGCALSLPHDGWRIDWEGGGSFTIPGKDSLKPWHPGPGNLQTLKDMQL